MGKAGFIEYIKGKVVAAKQTAWAGPSSALALSSLKNATCLQVVIVEGTLAAERIHDELKFFSQESEVLLFPDWETLPYDSFSPHQDLIAERLSVLERLLSKPQGFLIVPVTTLLHYLPPVAFIASQSFSLQQGERFDLTAQRQRFQTLGYQAVKEVTLPGEYAVRGSLFDIYPVGAAAPYRIDLFDDEIDSIRTFDVESQRSSGEEVEIELLPAKEFPLTDEGIALFRRQWREHLAGNPLNSPLYEDVSQGLAVAGIEYYIPLFFAKVATLFDYLPAAAELVCVGAIEEAATNYLTQVEKRYQQLRHDITKPLLAPEKLWLTLTALNSYLQKARRMQLKEQGEIFQTLPDIALKRQAKQPLDKFLLWQQQHNNKILFCADSLGRKEVFLELLKGVGIAPKQVNSWEEFLAVDSPYALTVAALDQGMVGAGLALIPESAFYGQRVQQKRRRKQKATNYEAIIRDLSELKIGDPVVHRDHGVGRYQGLVTLALGESQGEYVYIQYAEENKLYVPVSSLNLISRYATAEVDHAPLHTLGSEAWEKAKRKAKQKAWDAAAELLRLYASREARQGFAFAVDEQQYALFESQFSFEETPDQLNAITAVKQDLITQRPMDRLICGDVGFGKTEVAMRAAFIVVNQNKQVVVLVPTTLLAEQHGQTFKDRFSEWPIRIEVLSRFKSAKAQEKVIADVKVGKVDIIVGTHKLLQKGLAFHDLGLILLDEEHRFGVKHKEHLKQMRAEVDVLTMTATPIPRTLNFAMAGLRDLSIIATPPLKRLAAKTFIQEHHSGLVKEAISRELLRGGQVYYLHNDVKTIGRVAEAVKEWVPEARVSIAHGQMPERELEQVMSSFYHRRSNVLVCTTIIETGIDIPTANTIIIDRADKFGLAQLHQLRGRVGRSHHQAYAYLLTPPWSALQGDAQKRLEAIASLEELGAGFSLAVHDMEIRGAGEVLGEGQSGHIDDVGFSIYMDLLERAVKAIKAGKTPATALETEPDIELELNIPAFIPEDFMPDVHLRLHYYKVVAEADNSESIDELKAEVIDRFGSLPTTCDALFASAKLKLKLLQLGIAKLTVGARQFRFEFSKATTIEPQRLIHLIQTKPTVFRLVGATTLLATVGEHEKEKRIAKAYALLEELEH